MKLSTLIQSTIQEITTKKILQAYRDADPYSFRDADYMDNHLADLSKQIIAGLDDLVSNGQVIEVETVDNDTVLELDPEVKHRPPVHGLQEKSVQEMKLQAQVKKWKDTTGLSNLKLANLAGVSSPTIANILHSKKVSPDTFNKVSQAMNGDHAEI